MMRSISTPARAAASLLVALLAAVVLSGTARSQQLIVPKIGVRTFTGSVADLFDPGILVGVEAAFHRTPRASLHADLDLSLHPASGDTAFQVERGVAIGLTLGGRFLPLGRDTSRGAQPYIGADAGFTDIAWSLRDAYVFNPNHSFETSEGIIAFSLGCELGASLRTTSGLDLGLEARFLYHTWTTSIDIGQAWSVDGAPGFSGNEITLSAWLALPVRR